MMLLSTCTQTRMMVAPNLQPHSSKSSHMSHTKEQTNKQTGYPGRLHMVHDVKAIRAVIGDYLGLTDTQGASQNGKLYCTFCAAGASTKGLSRTTICSGGKHMP